MARKNRMSVYDGIYHVTSRIANRAMLLAEAEVWAFCIMDNHLHLFVHALPLPAGARSADPGQIGGKLADAEWVGVLKS